MNFATTSNSRLFTILVVAFICETCYGQESVREPKEAVDHFLQIQKQHKEMGAGMEPSELYARANDLIEQLRRENRKKAVPDFVTETSQKYAGFILALDEKAKSGEPLAIHYMARVEVQNCAVKEEAVRQGFAPPSSATECWSKPRSMFEAAYAKGVTASATMLGLMNERGWDGRKSKYLAAEWYMRAASDYAKNNDRTNALRALEWAEEQVADYPGLPQLKQRLLIPSVQD